MPKINVVTIFSEKLMKVSRISVLSSRPFSVKMFSYSCKKIKSKMLKLGCKVLRVINLMECFGHVVKFELSFILPKFF